MRKAALIGHPPDKDLFRSFIRFLRSDKSWSDALLIKLFEWAHAFKVGEIKGISFDAGQEVGGSVFMVPFLPEMREIKLRKVIQKVEEALSLASVEGCCVAAMGAFTSIVLQGIESDLEKKYGLRITSGNALTAAVIIRSIEELTYRFGMPLDKLSIGIVGASGDIGSSCAEWLGSRVSQLVLTARGMDPLEEMVQKHSERFSCPVKLSTDNRDVLEGLDVVICVTSAYTSLFSVEDFASGTIVCDASAPLNVTVPQTSRSDVLLYHGGIVSLPVQIDTGFDVGLASPFHFYGCQVEGLLIALDDSLPCSWGRGNITPEKLDRYREALLRYPALGVAYSCGNRVLSDADLDRFGGRIGKE